METIINQTESKQPVELNWRWGKNTQDTITIKAEDIETLKEKVEQFKKMILPQITQEEK